MDLVIQYLRATSNHTESGVVAREYADVLQSLLGFSIVTFPTQFDALLALVPPTQREKICWKLCKWCIIITGRGQALGSISKARSGHQVYSELAGNHAIQVALGVDILRVPEPLLTKDRSGRLLLHYAASHGMLSTCQEIVVSLGGASADRQGAVRVILQDDDEGLTPLYRAVMGNHTATAMYLIGIIDTLVGGGTQKALGKALHAALKSQNDEIVQSLLRGGADLGRQFRRGKTALYVAAEIGRVDYADLIVQALSREHAELDVREGSREWTPLFIACVNGYYDVVALLLREGSRPEITDSLGWTAKEHAVFRGHLAVGELFEPFDVRNLTAELASAIVSKSPYTSPRVRENEKVIIACLGTTRTDRVVAGLSSPVCSSLHSPGSYENGWFALEISAPGSTSGAQRVRLPTLDDQINDPFVFSIPESSEPRLLFRIIRSTRGCNGGDVIGSGAALLETNTHQFGTERQSLIRDQTIPILDKNTMDIAGLVTFTSFVVKPYAHLQTPRPIRTADTDSGQPVLVGHRGTGMNTRAHGHLQLGENTLESFISAAKLGASFVEFDVQVTRDLEAVAFHDFSLSETGTDVPIHDLTLEQFLHASNIQSPRGNPLSVLGTPLSRAESGRSRSRSAGGQFEAGAIQVRHRIEHTVDFKSNGFKANTRGDFIQDSFATLRDILVGLPPDIGCDMEISQLTIPRALLNQIWKFH